MTTSMHAVRIHFALVALLGALALYGCATASVEHRKNVMNEAAEKGQKVALKDSEQARKPLKDGQWVTLLVESLDSDNDLVLRTIKVLGVTGTSVRIEVESKSALKGGAVEIDGYEIDHFPVAPQFEYTKRQLINSINKMEFKRILTKRFEKDQKETSPEFLMFNRDMLQKLIMVGYVPHDSKPQPEPCTSGYVESSRCFAFAFATEYLDHKTVGRAHVHSEVPIVGFIHAADEYRSYKVVAFGEEGAVPRLTF